MRQYIPETTNDYIWKKTLLAVTKSSVNARDDYTRKITNGILEDRIPESIRKLVRNLGTRFI